MWSDAGGFLQGHWSDVGGFLQGHFPFSVLPSFVRSSFVIVAVCVWVFFVFLKVLSVFSIFIMAAVNNGFSFRNGGTEFCQRLYTYVSHVSFRD